MYVYWKSLFAFGLVFWILLCTTDVFSGHQKYKFLTPDEFYKDSVLPLHRRITIIGKRGLRFGFSLILWNVFAFSFSLVICSVIRRVSLYAWKWYHSLDKRDLYLQSSKSNIKLNSSKIPVRNISITKRVSESSIRLNNQVNCESSFPNLLQPAENPKVIQTLFTMNPFYPEDTTQSDKNNDNKCAKLKEEMVAVQAASLKEHAVLSRKLDAVSREKRELSKQLAVAHKENRAAKQQLEELLQEKSALTKKLETVAKEHRFNTKTKKVALAQLETVTNNVANLKLQLEQVSRDKEILENKMLLLKDEYIKLQERLNNNQQSSEMMGSEENLPERDNEFPIIPSYAFANENDYLETSVSETELDMKKIQQKIKQLERNLDNFNPKKLSRNTMNIAESDTNNNTMSCQDTIKESSTPNTEVENEMEERDVFPAYPLARDLGLANIVDFCDLSEDENDSSLTESQGSHSSTDLDPFNRIEPRRIVSSSAAFQNFLKLYNSINPAKSPNAFPNTSV